MSNAPIPIWMYVWAPISWLLYMILALILDVLGYILVPICAITGAYEMRESSKYEGRIVRAFSPSFMWLWSNEEEGIGHYGNPKWPLWLRIIYSECVRNPSNNARYVPYLSFIIKPKNVRFIATPDKNAVELYDEDNEDFAYFAWHGLYSCIRVQRNFGIFGRRRLWIGWKIYPEDIKGLPVWDHRTAGVGFARQFRRLK